MKQTLAKGFLSIYFIALSFLACSQGGVSINNNNAPAHSSAMLDVSSTSSPYLGMLIPRMNTANRNSIISPATGLQIFNTDCGVNEYYTGTCWISIGQNLKSPLPITCSGTTDFCANESRTFTISPVTGAANYYWFVPAGATITSGQGTTSATVLFGNNSGQVCVRSENACEMSQNTCIDIHINPVPPTPGNITGLTTVVPNSSTAYFIASVAGAGVYNWSVPAGATITSGVGTTTITVHFSCSAISGNISVTAQSNCGASTANTLAITVSSVVASAGPSVSSPGTIGGSPTASGGTSPYTYNWQPSTTLSSTTVSNPSTSLLCTAVTYTVTVTDLNGCTATSSATASNSSPPPAPGSISGPATVTSYTTGNVYSINAVNTATSYTWTVPAGASISLGQGTTSITVSYGASGSGNISVTATSSCGTSPSNSLAVTINPTVVSFTNVGSTAWTPPAGITSIDVLVVAGGGSGGGSTGGGGGGGGVIYQSSYAVTNQPYTVTVGGGAPSAGNQNPGIQGSNSVFGTLIAIGGGGGAATGNSNAYPPTSGGSGGGGQHYIGNSPGANGTPGQGYAGGDSNDGIGEGGGGGGGGVGGTGGASGGGNGGPGFASSITGTLTYYGGGGGGGADSGLPAGTGGIGGGGAGSSNAASAGAPNTGGGGGGGWFYAGGNSGAGGSGIVIISY